MQRPFERADGRDDGGISIGHGGGHHAGSEGGSVKRVLSVEDEGLIKGLDIGAVGSWGAFLITEDHPEEVLRKALLAGGLDVAFAAAAPDIKRNDGGNLGHKLQRGATDVLGILGVFLWVLGTDIGNGGTQYIHWVAR